MRSRGSSPASRHGGRKDSKSQPSTGGVRHGKQSRPSLVPPDIVLESEDTETHEHKTLTLVSGQSCNDVIMSHEQLQEANRRGKYHSNHVIDGRIDNHGNC